MITMTTKPVIHVGVDGSWRDTGALEWALQESLLRHEPLRAVHVIEERWRHEPYGDQTVIDDAAMDLVKEVQQHMKQADSVLDHDAGIVVGPPATTLAGLAEDSQMLVVGRRGMGGFRRMLIGSTSEAVANEATVPVVVVPDGWKPSEHTGPVLVGLDATGEHSSTIEFAATAAVERHVPLRLVHVWELPNVYSWDATSIQTLSEEWAESAQSHFDDVAKQWRHKYPDLEIQVDVTRGHPVEGVISAAESADAQLLVLGGRRRHKLTAMLLGSVARGVLRHATCPVAIVHAPQDDS